jgi:cobalt-zinc-cadmium efflux system protein
MPPAAKKGEAEMSKNHKIRHQHGLANLENIRRAFYIGIFLNISFTIAEYIVGYSTNSLALIADASHNLSDVASLIISLMGMKLTQKAATLAYTYGYKKASILASLINSVLLITVVINIFIEGIDRLSSPPEIAGKVIIFTALIGVGINTISAFLFYNGQKEDINVKGAFLHLLVDAMVSVGVVISGVIIYYTDWSIVDPIISFFIGIIILVSTWGLLKESLKLTLDGVPKDIDLNQAKKIFADNPDVKYVHHIHIWALSSSENALTAHICLQKDNCYPKEIMSIKNQIKEQLKLQNIQHATIELDSNASDCNEANC